MSKVALCISGQPRRALETFPYIYNNIIQPNNADVFIHMHYYEDALYMEKSHADNGPCLLEKDIDKKVIELYKPVQYLIEKPRNFSKSNLNCSDKRLENHKKMNHHKNWSDEEHKKYIFKNLISMYYSIFKANELKEVYANENGILYDYVIRIRFDAIIQQPLICSNYDPNFIYYAEIGQPDNLISDWINFGSNAIMNIYSSMFFNLEYINTFQFYKKEEREENTLEPSDTYSGIYEHMLRDLMHLYKIPKRGFHLNTRLI
jgi:hypothetical protein